MFLQGRLIVIWLCWFIGGVCGVVILLVVVCYCRLMPRHQKSFDEQYLKENYTIKENHIYTSQGYTRVRTESRSGGGTGGCQRPASYSGACPAPPEPAQPPPGSQLAQYASSSMLDELEAAEGAVGCEALKTRSLPAFLRPRPRPLSSETDLYQLYAKVSQSKKHKSRMRSEHAAIIALSKSRSQALDDAHAVIVYDQRTQL